MTQHRIISRAESGLVPPKHTARIAIPTPRLWLHHSAGAMDANNNGVWWDDVRAIQDFHMRPTSQGGRGWSDVGYSYLVGGGQIFEGRGAGIAGGHTKGDNTFSHGICLIGDYTWMTPKQADLEAIAWLMWYGRENRWWRDLTGPHKDAPGASTACCGINLINCIPDLRVMAANPESPTPTPPTPTPIIPELEIDMTTAFQLLASNGSVYLFMPGQQVINMGGVPAIHSALANRSGHNNEVDQFAPLLNPGKPVPAAEMATFSERWNRS